ncbi:MAG TPA: ABC transporter permease subunit [Acidimicrobiales bacterium]|nr:ABC transporter permease subunit [Acidimicrobiales bacterium]
MIARFTARRAARSGALWGLLFGGLVIASAAGYASTFPTVASRETLARSFGGNAGLAALLGPAHRLETVAGFTAWRCLGILSILGAFWGLLIGTRLLRGEEDSGGWELLLAGPTTRAGATVQAVAGLGAGVGALWAVTAVCAVLAGRGADVDFSVTGALFLSVALVASALVFVAIGVVMSQLAGNRRQANALGAVVLGAAFLVRMVADAGTSLTWLRWASPFGWAEELRPLTVSRALPLIPIVLITAALLVGSVLMARSRDLGASILPRRDSRPPRLALLGGPTRLTVRLGVPLFVAWIAALATMGFVMGMVAQSASKIVSGSETIERMLARLGGIRPGAAAYLGFAFVFASALVAFAAAGQIAAMRREEADGFLDNVLVRPTTRARWLIGRLVVGATTVSLAGIAGGLAAWCGSATQHSGVAFTDLFAAGVNIVPPGLLVLGVGTLVYGVVPRPAPTIAYAIVTWSFIVQLIASLVTTNAVVVGSSLLHYVTPAPATDPNWGSAARLVAIGCVAAALGVAAFARRDLASR